MSPQVKLKLKRTVFNSPQKKENKPNDHVVRRVLVKLSFRLKNLFSIGQGNGSELPAKGANYWRLREIDSLHKSTSMESDLWSL